MVHDFMPALLTLALSFPYILSGVRLFRSEKAGHLPPLCLFRVGDARCRPLKDPPWTNQPPPQGGKSPPSFLGPCGLSGEPPPKKKKKHPHPRNLWGVWGTSRLRSFLHNPIGLSFFLFSVVGRVRFRSDVLLFIHHPRLFQYCFFGGGVFGSFSFWVYPTDKNLFKTTVIFVGSGGGVTWGFVGVWTLIPPFSI